MPVTFRINSGEAGFERLSQMLKDPDFIKQFIESAEQEEVKDEEQAAEESKEPTGAAAVNMDQTVLVK